MKYPHLENIDGIDGLDHDCKLYTELREREKGAGTAYAYQCQFCGEFRGGEVSKKTINSPPEKADINLNDAYLVRSKQLTDEFLDSRVRPNNSAFRKQIKSPEETYKDFSNFLEDYCLQHSLDQKRVIQSFLVKQREIHVRENFSSSWSNEDQLKSWLEIHLSPYFHIYSEVVGTGYLDRKAADIRIDFILKAKDELIRHGFTEQHIGVEVKFFSPKSGKGFHGKSSRGVFQALSYWYSGARWKLPDGRAVELATVLLFSNLSFQDEAEALFNTFDSHYRKTWNAYLSIANHANIGELKVRTWNGKINFWAMEYNGAKYFSMNEKFGYRMGNPNVINKARIGNLN